MAVQLDAMFAGLRFENPFLLASAPPTESDGNIMRAFDAGWVNVLSSRIVKFTSFLDKEKYSNLMN